MRRYVYFLPVFIACLWSAAMLHAQEQPAEDVDAASLPFRTALYHDPTLAPPLERLIQLYQRAGRTKDLVGIYRQHVAQYPEDTGALTVLVRLLIAVNDPDAGTVVRSAAEKHPDNAFLQFLLFEHLQRTGEPGALDTLDRAITKELELTRKRAWIEQLLPMASAEGRPELAKRHLDALAGSVRTAQEKLEVARQMITQKLYEPAISVLTGAATLAPAAETGVEIELAIASAELGLERNEAAGSRLDRLLGRLAADYWRRAEILHRRIALVKSDAEREAMVKAARARWKAAPDSDSAALELSQLLAAFEFRREALTVLLEASKRVPGSEKLEKAALDLFDRLRDERGRETYLAERLRLAPNRGDLALARSRSLFILGRRDEALQLFESFVAKLDPSTRQTQILELARFLRRSALHADAAELFQRAVEQAPSRMDLRRELAETWLALGQKQKARDVFAGAAPDEAETESLLDVVQFFLKEGMLAEAKDALGRRVTREPQNFDLRLMQLTVAGRLADQTTGRQLITEILPLTDTDARYRRWLEGAVTFHETFDSEGEFLAGEEARLIGEDKGWDREHSERRLIFADVAAAHGRKAAVTSMLEDALTREIPPEVRVELRRRRLALLENDAAQAQAAEKELQELLREDAARADEYRIRLALLFVRDKRHDRARAIIGWAETGETVSAVDVQKVNDAALLAGLESMMREVGGSPKLQLDILDRLTTLEPGNRAAWERWITVLASSGDEERLRITLQRLLAGIDRLPLSSETRDLLQKHLLASQWRSINLALKEGVDERRGSELLPLVESAGRLAKSRNEWLWTMWARAFTLNRLGRNAARDQAIAELERMISQAPESSASEKSTATDEAGAAKNPVDGLVTFPDGFGISLTEARQLLTSPSHTEPSAVPVRSGPSGKLQIRWAFETDRQAAILKVMPVDRGRVLVLDAEGRHYYVDSSTGKVIWTRDGAKPLRPQRDDRYGYSGGNMATVPPPAPAFGRDRLFVGMSDRVECWSADKGELLWRAMNVDTSNSSHGTFPILFVHDQQVLVCDATSASISALDGATGKLRWQREYGTKSTAPLGMGNSGASYSNGRILLYGRGTWVVSAVNGEVLWSFDARQVDDFPVSLADATPVVSTPAPSPYGNRAMFYRGGVYPGRSNFMAFDYAQRARYGGMWSPQPGSRVALVNPVTAWAAAAAYDGQPRLGVLHGERLLLFASSTVYSLRLDVPFGTAPISNQGTLVGLSGRLFCLLSGNVLSTVDSDSGRSTGIPLTPPGELSNNENGAVDEEYPGPRQLEEYDAVLDGVVVYVSGRKGVTAYHARTGQRLTELAWPASIAPKAASVTPQTANAYYLPHGIMRPNPYGQGNVQPLTGAVAEGTLYMRSEPSRLVALVSDQSKSEVDQ